MPEKVENKNHKWITILIIIATIVALTAVPIIIFENNYEMRTIFYAGLIALLYLLVHFRFQSLRRFVWYTIPFVLGLIILIHILGFTVSRQYVICNSQIKHHFVRVLDDINNGLSDDNLSFSSLRDSLVSDSVQLGLFLKTKSIKSRIDSAINNSDQWKEGRYLENAKKDYDSAKDTEKVAKFGFVISLLVYGLIFIYAFKILIFWHNYGLKFNNKLDDIQKDMDTICKINSNTPSIEYANYFRLLIVEREDILLGKSETYSGLLTRLGLIGTLFGLAMAFYSAGSSMPVDISIGMDENAKKLITSGLVQTIMNYSFSVVTSLVAYTFAFCLHILGGHVQRNYSYIDKYDSYVLSYLKSANGTITIEQQKKQVIKETEIENAIKEMLTAFRTGIAQEIKKVRKHVSDFKKALVETKNKLEIKEIDELQTSLSKTNKKLNGIDDAMKKAY